MKSTRQTLLSTYHESTLGESLGTQRLIRYRWPLTSRDQGSTKSWTQAEITATEVWPRQSRTGGLRWQAGRHFREEDVVWVVLEE